MSKVLNTDIRELFKKLSGVNEIPVAVLGTVVSVDEAEMTCEVKPIDDGAHYVGVYLASEANTSNMYKKPAIDSLVLISPMNESLYYVSMYSEIDEVWLKGSQYDGLVKVGDLVTKLNNLESDINDLKTAFSTWVTVPNDGGAALKAITATWYGSTLTPTTQSDLENTTVKHG
jgi:hypothetical protein